MPAVLTRQTRRTSVAMRLAAQLRQSRRRARRKSSHAPALLRVRLSKDGMLVGRAVLSLPFDLS